MTGPELIPTVAAGAVTIAAAATDLRQFKVYNALTVPAFALGLITSAWLGGWDGLGSSLLGSALGLGLLAAFCAVGGVGPGDVKLLGALGAWLGPLMTYRVFIASALAAGAYAVVLVLLRHGVLGLAAEALAMRRVLFDPKSWRLPEADIEAEVRRPDRRRRLVPFAAMTCLGYFATIAWWGVADSRPDRSDAMAAASAPAPEFESGPRPDGSER